MAFTDSGAAGSFAAPNPMQQLTLPAEPGQDTPVSESSPQDDSTDPNIEQHKKLLRWSDAINIADELDDSKLGEIGQKVINEFKIDENSRSDWVTKTKAAMDLAMQVSIEKQYPWPKAANVIFPLMTTAATQFAARAYPAIVSGRNVVKGVVVGSDAGIPQLGQNGQPIIGPDGKPVWQQYPGEKRLRAEKIGEHMSWQLLDEQKEWEAETDQLLHVLPICGCVFRKTYFDPGKGRNMSVMVTPFDVSINYNAKAMEIAPRITETIRFYPVEIKEMERAGLFRTLTYTGSPNANGDTDAAQDFLEQHRYLDLDDDDFPEPYVVTVHKETSRIVRIRARYEANGIHFSHKDHKIVKIDPIHYYTKYDFLPNPDGGIYGLGFGQLLRPVNEAVNTTLNMLLDSGHLANTGGGFIGKGLSMNTGAMRFTPGEYKMVNVPGSVVKDSIVPLQFPGPSQVLFQLLGLLIESGKEIASIKDVLTGEQNQHNVPATTTMALIEQGLKQFTAIYKRVHRSLKDELDKLYRLNGLYLPIEQSYQVGDEWKTIRQSDYQKGAGIEPYSDPTMVSDMQRMAKAQFLLQFANDPMFNGLEIRRRVLDAANETQVEQLLVQNPPPNPALIAKGMELEIKGQREKAAELKDLANAILFFAQADKAVGDSHIAWVGQQLESWKTQFESASAGQGQPGPGGMPPMPGAPQAPAGPPPMPSNLHPHAVAPPQNAQGPIGIPPQGGPPVPGARQAPDGHFYVPDPRRPGKYLMVSH